MVQICLMLLVQEANISEGFGENSDGIKISSTRIPERWILSGVPQVGCTTETMHMSNLRKPTNKTEIHKGKKQCALFFLAPI